ncbi:copper transport ctr4 [Fusarium mundagurra]|uniref:Copper transport protein n=1 Tax=Fusarium mundagurra TaxID=1567541 RepID=A0A8H6DM82_9HYPO|nr:copper transport ctr4 [Fusarium mundagurra]
MISSVTMHPTSATALANSSSSSSAMELESCLRNNMLWNWNTIGACFISEGWYIGSAVIFAFTCLGAFGVAMLSEFVGRVSREWERHRFARDVGSPQEAYPGIPGIELAPLQPPAAQPVPAQPSDAQSAAAQPVPVQPADAQSARSAAAQSAGAQSAGAQSAGAQPAQPADAQSMASQPASASGLNNRVPPLFPSRVEHALIKALLHVLQQVIAYGLILMAVSFNGYVIICIFIGHYLGLLFFGRDPLTESNKPNAYQRVFQQPVICCDV